MSFARLESAVALVPPGRWGVAVSGGADSVALLCLLRCRADVHLHVVHLDHQTRGPESAADARFVRALAEGWGISCTVGARDQVEARMSRVPVNASARYRAARFSLFEDVVNQNALSGIMLAHHADDQAETILHRLLRGVGPAGLEGMSTNTLMGRLLLVRPLLGLRRSELRTYLTSVGQAWREDASNQSDDYLRNRLRSWLNAQPALHATLIGLSNACRAANEWVRVTSPALSEVADVTALRGPRVLAREAARRWLMARGAPPGELSDGVVDRLCELGNDAGTAPRQHFPGGLLVRRASGRLMVVRTVDHCTL